MKVGCCALSYRDVFKDKEDGLFWFLKEAERIGLDGVELTSYYFRDTSDAYVYCLKRACASLGLDIYATATGTNFCVPDGEERDKQVEHVKRWVEVSSKLGSPALRVFAGNLPEGRKIEEGLEWVVGCLRKCAEYGEKFGVMIALENHAGVTATAELVHMLYNLVNHEWFGINLDTGNFHTQDPYRDIEEVANIACTVHAKITSGSTSGKFKIDYEKICGILQRVNFKGYLSIEYEEEGNPLEDIPAFVHELKTAISGTAVTLL